jgi:hypothetical protein
MEWLSENPHRGQAMLTCVALLITANIIWFGRRKLPVAIPCALLFLLIAATAIPSFIPARQSAHRNACINNLRQIRDAKADWAQANHKSPTDVPTEADLVGTNKFLHFMPVCPSGGTYIFGAVNEDPKCSLTNHGHKLP